MNYSFNIVTESCTQGVIFATVAFGVGIDSLYVERVIHFGVPRTMESFFQESRGAGRGGRQFCLAAKSSLYVNHDMDANVQGMQPIVAEYCKYPQSGCRRKTVLKNFGIGIPSLVISRFGDHHLSP